MCRSPTQGKDPYDAFNVASGKARSSDNPPVIPPRLSPESTTLPARSLFSDGLLARLSQDPNLARFLKSSSSNSSDGNNSNSRGNGGQQQTAPSTLYGRRISIESLPLRRYPSIFIITDNNDWLTFVCVCVCGDIISRYSPSPPHHPPPQPPARRMSQSSNSAGSASVPASPVLQPRHMANDNFNSFTAGFVLPRHLTPEPQRRNIGQRFEL